MPLYNPSALNPDFGGDYFNAGSEGESSTTDTTFQTKLTLNATTTKTGLFILIWHINVGTSAADKMFEIIIDDESSAVLGRFYTRYAQSTARQPFTGFLYLDLPANTNKTFNLKYRRETGNPSYTIYVSQARLSFYKVS